MSERKPAQDSKTDIPTVLSGYDYRSKSARAAMSRFLIGHGVEFGPGRDPFPLGPEVASVQYVEKPLGGTFGEAHQLPDSPLILGSEVVLLDADTEDLTSHLQPTGFIVASHVIEHLANPMRFIAQCYESLAPNGVLLLVVPDKRYTFDVTREATSLRHLIGEFRANTKSVDRQHIVQALIASGEIRDQAELLPELEEQHRTNSVHAHCWDWMGFVGVLVYLDALGVTSWRLLDLDLPDQSADFSNEMVIALGKRTQAAEQTLVRQVFELIDALAMEPAATRRMGEMASESLRLARYGTESDTPPVDLFGLWNVWRRRPDLAAVLKSPLESEVELLHWVTTMAGVEPDAAKLLEMRDSIGLG